MADRLFGAIISLLSLTLAVLLLLPLLDVTWHGYEHLSWSFFLAEPSNAGRSGGIISILAATFWLLSIALTLAIPIGLAIAIWLSEYTSHTQILASAVRFGLDVLAGVPSIVFGLFGNALFCIYLGLGYSLLSGGLTLACMILPFFIRTCEAGLRAVTDDWRVSAEALAISKWSMIRLIVLPSAAPTLFAGLMLAVGRAMAETAALVFTSGYSDRMPSSWLDSGRALSVHIYDLTMNVTGGDGAAYGSALVLILSILAVNGLAHAISQRWLIPNRN